MGLDMILYIWSSELGPDPEGWDKGCNSRYEALTHTQGEERKRRK